MINRVLIRMKVVQILYSYLIVDKPFSLESQPSAPTKEKRFAYNLYLELINLMGVLAHEVKGKYKTYPLVDTRFILKTQKDDHIKALNSKSSEEVSAFNEVVPGISEEIRQSLLFKEFEKNREKGEPTDDFWENVFNSIIIVNPGLNSIIRKLPGYTLSGLERTKDLFATTFKNFYATKDNLDDALKYLHTSLSKARDLYMRLLSLPVDLTNLRIEKLEQNRRKYLAGVEDLNPNMRLANNRIVKLLENNPIYEEYEEKNHISWKTEDPELLDILLKALLESELYKNYITVSEDNIKKDSEFWQDALQDVIINNVNFLEFLETKSVFWNDDLESMTSFAIKTLKKLGNSELASSAVLPMFKDEKDELFGDELVRYVIRNKDIYQGYIEQALQREKWESDRLAFMDVVILMTAMAEIINYPEIPLQVSINEYIEIAKSYSGPKSGQFINGILASLIPVLRQETGFIK